MAGLCALASQIRRQVLDHSTPNTARISEEISLLFRKIEVELEKDASEILIVLVKANVSALDSMRENAEALSVVDKALYEAFVMEAKKLLLLFPVLNEIDNPFNAEIISDMDIEIGQKFVDQFCSVVTDAEAEQVIGASIPGVTRDLMVYPWQTPKQRIIGFASFAAQVRFQLNNPPDWVSGGQKYADLVTKVNAAWQILGPMLRQVF